jgi:hypothetical protein
MACECLEWFELTQDQNKCQAIVNTVMDIRVAKKVREMYGLTERLWAYQ